MSEERFYKVLKAGRSFHGGDFEYSLPKNGKPGKWHRIKGETTLCYAGFHVTTEPARWWESGASCYEVEIERPGNREADKLVVGGIRLVRELSVEELAGLNVFLGDGSYSTQAACAWAGENSNVVARGNSKVEARGNSKVEARGNSKVEARGNSNVVARGNSKVEARGNSKVEARGNSKVEARGNSNVVAWENSNVVAWENSKVEARGNSNVVAGENSNVVAWGNSKVEAWENSNVVARGNSKVEARGNSNVVAWENSNVVAWGSATINSYLGWGQQAPTVTVKEYAVHINRQNGKPVVEVA